VFVIALAWGAAWTWYPPLAGMRLLAPPGGQAGAVIALVVSLVSLLAIPAVRTLFRTADVSHLVGLGAWRLVYGAMLMVVGSLGGLPAAFFVSAGIGDMVVGLWALWLIMRRASVTQRELIAWNALGLIDLLHVITLAAIHLRPFFLAQPDLPALNLLPLVGVPVFIALHVLTLWGLFARRSARTGPGRQMALEISAKGLK
jgi:hypothetical protein